MKLAACLIAAALAVQSSPPVHPVSGRRIAPVMGWQGAEWLERDKRIDEEAPDEAVRLLQIASGASVADIGAGSGYMTVRLAEKVGPTGRVYANEVQQQKIEILRRRLEQGKIRTGLLGQEGDDE